MKNDSTEDLLERIIEEVKKLIDKKLGTVVDPQHVFIDNQEFMQLLKISPRTAQNYRDQGLVSYSQVGSKVYYQLSDVYEMLEKHKKEAFNQSKKWRP